MFYDELIASDGNLHLGNWKRYSKNSQFLEQLHIDTNWMENDSSDLERLYCVIKEIKAIPKCKFCGDAVKFKLFKTGYSNYCSIKCSVNDPDVQSKRTKSWISKNGKGTQNRETINEKAKTTSLMRYGTESPNQNKEIKEKQRESKCEIYGDNWAIVITQKAKDTITNRYGVNNAFQLPHVRDRAIKSQRSHAQDGFDLLANKNTAENLYEKGTIKQIGNKLGISFSNVAIKLNSHGIPLTRYSSKSGLEKEVLDFIKENYSGEIVSGDRTLLNGKEVDILLPELKLGIEFDGLYWHSEKGVEYHLDKTEKLESLGFSLFHIFEDEWVHKAPNWKSMILNKLGKSNKIYARNCVIKEVSRKTGIDFFEENHLQGSVSRGNSLGLFYDGVLVGCLCYGSSRYDERDLEIYRYANILNHTVVGGFSKLLKQLKGRTVVSYANRRWSEGKLYQICGFEFEHNTRPNYFYVKDGVRYSRQKFQKHKLKNNSSISGYKEELTESEIMTQNGYRKIYDCGNKKFVINSW